MKELKMKGIEIKQRWHKDINLLYAYEIQTKKKTVLSKNIITAVIVELLIIGVISAYMNIEIIGQRKEIEKTKSKIESYAGIQKEIDEFDRIKKLYEDKKFVFDSVADKNHGALEVLSVIEETLPSEMSVEGINIKDDSVSFIVKSSKEENIAQFINNFQSTGKFTNITVSGISGDKDTKRTSINAELKRKWFRWIYLKRIKRY